MLVLFETSGGYAIFKVLDEKKVQSSENLYKDFENPEKAGRLIQLQHFKKFKDTAEAMAAANACIESKMSKSLKKFLKKMIAKEDHEQLAVADAKLGSIIKDKLNITCINNSNINELMRCIRSQRESLIGELHTKDMCSMALGLAHGLSRYKLKFSPDKIDTMIIQAVSLLDDLDKELNNYIMRCREWYGWHFPELGKVLTEHTTYIRTVLALGFRTNIDEVDLSAILTKEEEEQAKLAAGTSIGTEISEDDITNISHLCTQVLEMLEYKSQLNDYLKNRIFAIAPNLATLVGELVAARLISHAGSLMNLAKHPASTVQILGAEKALFRALKKGQATPKYGLIYHAQVIGQTGTALKGKMSRVLAAKAALCTRVDALGEDISTELGTEHRAKVMMKLKGFEENVLRGISGTGKQKAKFEKYSNKSEVKEYKPAVDFTLPIKKEEPEEEVETEEPTKKKRKKKKSGDDAESPSPKKVKVEEVAETETSGEGKKKKKKKKAKQEAEDD